MNVQDYKERLLDLETKLSTRVDRRHARVRRRSDSGRRFVDECFEDLHERPLLTGG